MANLTDQPISAIWVNLQLLSMKSTLLVSLIIGPFIAVFLYAFYNIFLHPLRRYPGPLLWTSFRLPYVIATHQGRLHRELKEFHTKYGPIVRIAPNELSYADSAAWKDIFVTRPGHQPFQRNRTWFKKQSPDEPHSIMGYDEAAHSKFRRAFANSFSDKSLRDQSPVIEGYVELFIKQLRAISSGQRGKETAVDLEKWLHYLTFDISGDLSFGEPFDCLKNGKAHPWVDIAQDFGKGLALVASINTYPPIDKLLRYIIPKKVIQRMKDHREMSAAKAMKRLALDTQRPDFVTPTKKYSSNKIEISNQEWEINMAIMVFAASETVASALTAIVRELVQSRGVLHRLTQEVRSTFDTEKEITISSTGNLEYLNAVINEGLRLDPPSSISVPRIVPQGGDTICGQWVPGGTYVAVNQHAANRQAYNFRHPNSFIPERFLNPDPKTDDMSMFQPFILGRHSCIGMNLAYAEMRVILARLLWAFDISLKNEQDRWDWGAQRIFIFWEKKPLEVILRRANQGL